MKEEQHLVLYLINGPLVIHAEPGEENKVAEWLLKVMSANGVAIFKDTEGVIRSVVRGAAILGFGFESVQYDPEMADLHKRRLIAETECMELNAKQLRDRNSGDEWKNGYYE